LHAKIFAAGVIYNSGNKCVVLANIRAVLDDKCVRSMSGLHRGGNQAFR